MALCSHQTARFEDLLVCRPFAWLYWQAVKQLRLGMIGGGTVGLSTLTLLWKRKALFEHMGYNLQIAPVLVRDPGKTRVQEYEGVTFTDDPSVLKDADVLFDMMGGTSKVLEFIEPHLRAGKPVVTANKAVLAERWDVLKPYAQNGQLYYESSVMAGTPVIGPLTGTLRSSDALELHAILSGTCNYILTRMESGANYNDALNEAQELGYAEDPPTLDVGGFDAAHKLCVLARLTVDPDFKWESLEIKGIDGLSSERVLEAVQQGKRVKLVGSILPNGSSWRAVVRPVILEADHPLAQSASSRNAMVFTGDASGTVIIQGGGAGGLVTASAVVGDLIDHLAGVSGHKPRPDMTAVPVGHKFEQFEEI
jgi:homoserine dehydrogenase